MRTLSFLLSLFVLAGCVNNQVTRPPPKPVPQNPDEWQGTDSAPRNSRGNKSPYTVLGKTYNVLPDSLGYLEIGVASWYGRKFHGRLTSNGETFDMFGLTAAHRTLPIPTIVRVTNLDNGRKALVRINDRGPFHDNRLIDLSYEAAVKLGFADQGTAPVVVEAVDERNYPNLHRVDGHKSFYLQVGAFSRLDGAERRLTRVRRLIEANAMQGVGVHILQSEQKTTILHKVWMGPIASPERVDKLTQLVQSANLGVPLRVEVD